MHRPPLDEAVYVGADADAQVHPTIMPDRATHRAIAGSSQGVSGS